MKKREYSVWKFIGILSLGLLIFAITSGLVTGIIDSMQKGQKIDGLSYTREAYLSGCTGSALTIEGVTSEMANSYCGCVYDQGVATYGITTFSNMDHQLNITNTVSPEMNTLINNCVVQIGAQ